MLRQRLGLSETHSGGRSPFISRQTPESWSARVTTCQQRLRIDNIDIQSDEAAKMSPSTLKRRLTKYKREEVRPATAEHFSTPNHLPLPWGWLASTIISTRVSEKFDVWWMWSCSGAIQAMHAPWKLCAAPVAPTRKHLTAECEEFARRAQLYGICAAIAFDRPESPEMFHAQLVVAREAWVANCSNVARKKR